FEILYVRYYDIVYRHVRGILHETDLAAGITAETFVRLFQHSMLLAPTHKPLKRWLLTVAGNLARNELRRRSRVVPLDEQRVAFNKPDRDYQYLVGTHVREIRCAIHALPPFERTCVTLRYTEGMTTMDIARRLHCSRRQVTVALGDSYKTLRRKLAYLSPSRSLPCPKRK
ncbi:MAG: sigma-70 family RNA polymerase sigma factor, partial [Candidatus Cryosericum sp.]